MKEAELISGIAKEVIVSSHLILPKLIFSRNLPRKVMEKINCKFKSIGSEVVQNLELRERYDYF